MWLSCFVTANICMVATLLIAGLIRTGKRWKNWRPKLIKILIAGAFTATLLMFYPLHYSNTQSSWQACLLTVFNSVQLFGMRCSFSVIKDSLALCPGQWHGIYQLWFVTMLIIAPLLSATLILSFFKNVSAHCKYWLSFFKEVYIFSSLNEKSLALATDIHQKRRASAIVFTNVGEESGDWAISARELGAICFKKDILEVNFQWHSSKRLWFLLMDDDEAQNVNQALKLIETYKDRKNTRVYPFSTKVEGELLLTSVEKGFVQTRRVNDIRSMVNRLLFAQGQTLFTSAWAEKNGQKCISAVVVGMGRYGTEMVKALSWFGQMDGYTLQIDAFDRDPLAEDKFRALAPELMSEQYNRKYIPGEAQYDITIHSGMDTRTESFAKAIQTLENASYVFVALGDDSANIQTAVNLRMYFERMKIKPVIQAIVHNTRQKNALQGIRNFKNQEYNIDFIGDLESVYTEDVIISEMEQNAWELQCRWGDEETFWPSEYHYRSSLASALHKRVRTLCGIRGADKTADALTLEERDFLETIEHRRWNAYMRAEGYVYSGSKDESSRNDLAKMHHNLVEYADLSEEDKRKDSRIGAK